MKATLHWENDLNFKAKAESGVWVPMGPSAAEGREPTAATPMEPLLMDIVWILQKKRVVFDDFKVEIDAEKTEEHPKVYSSIHLKFIFTGKGLNMKDLEQAAKLSAEKYCSVGAMLGKAAKITHEVEIIEK